MPHLNPRRPRPQLGRALVVSVGFHLVVALMLLVAGWIVRPIDAIDPRGDLDVEVVDLEPGEAARRGMDQKRSDAPREKPAQARRVERVRVRPDRSRPAGPERRAAKRPAGPARGVAIEPAERGEHAECLLSMRGCRPGTRTAQPRPPDRHASFWGNRPRHRRPASPVVVSRAEANGVKLVRYDDGGRLFSSTRGGQRKPDLGTVGLVELAKGRVGGRSGREACNPYRLPLRGKRTLVLLVDTSASIDVSGRSSKAIYCAAGAALAALGRGYDVEVMNFSTVTLHQPPTRDREAIYRTLSTVQRKSTLLPEAGRLVSSSGRPRDFVLVTDSAIGNLKCTLPAYEKATRTHADNRALLYLLGDGVVCPRCHFAKNEICYACPEASQETLVALERAGFVPHYVEQPPTPLPSLVARQLRRLFFP